MEDSAGRAEEPRGNDREPDTVARRRGPAPIKIAMIAITTNTSVKNPEFEKVRLTRRIAVLTMQEKVGRTLDLKCQLFAGHLDVPAL